MGMPLRVLIINHEQCEAKLMERVLRRAGHTVTWRRVNSPASARAALDGATWDVVVADASEADLSVGEVRSLLKEYGLDLPIIMVTGAIGEERAAAAIRAGADALVRRDNLERLAPAVEAALRAAADESETAGGDDSLRRRAATLSCILASATEYAVVAADLDFRIIHYNPAAERLFGHPAEEVLGKTVHEVHTRHRVPPEHFARAVETIKREGKYEYEIRSGDGERFIHAVVMPLRDESHECMGYVLFARDVTESIRARQAQARLTTAVEQAAEAIAITDTAGIVQYVNPAFERVTGYTQDEAAGHEAPVFRYGREKPSLGEQVWGALGRGEVWRGRFVHDRKDGTTYDADATVSPIRDPAGAISNYVVIMRDVTHEVALERRLRQAQKMQAVGTLAGGIAHDFNNLLTAIFGYTDMAKATLPEDHPAIRTLEMVEQAARQARDVTKSLLTFSREHVTTKAPVNLSRIVTETLPLLRHTLPAAIELVSHVADEEVWVHADTIQLQQILLNLAVNARDAMPHAGQLRLSVDARETADPKTGTCGPADAARWAVVEVADTGRGMSEDVLSRATEPFFSTKPRGQGTGLGLAIIHGIVSDHRGHLEVHSKPGSGTRVTVVLPCCDPPEAPPAEADRGRAPHGRGEVVIVAEDDDHIRAIMSSALRSHGYVVVQASNSTEACAELRRHHHVVRLVVLEADLPTRGGTSCLQEIRAMHSELPVIVVTGGARPASEAPPDARERMLSKPFQVSEFVTVVAQTLQQVDKVTEAGCDR